ncbi:MAG: hypothetical protein ACTSU2_00200, partial [Promethearchaeota archaeon]
MILKKNGLVRIEKIAIILIATIFISNAALIFNGKSQNIVGNFLDNNIYSGNNHPSSSALEKLTNSTISIGTTIKTGVTIADINGDGKNELVFGSNNYNLYAYAYSSSLGYYKLWNYTTGGMIWSTPIVSDIDGDSEKEILFGSFDHVFYCLNSTGGVKWSYNDGYPNPINVDFAVGKINASDSDEIVFAKFDRLYVLNGSGDLQWYHAFTTQKINGITLADLNGDGVNEILFNLNNQTLVAMYGNGTIYKMININLSLDATPLVLNGKIITQNSSNLIALDYNFEKVWSLNNINGNITSPVAADLNHDGKDEIVINLINLNKTLVVSESGTLLYTKEFEGYFSKNSVPAIADINNDTIPDILLGSSIFYLLNYSLDQLFERIVITVSTNLPTVGDVNGDGNPKLVFTTDLGDVYIINLPSTIHGDPWPNLRYDSMRTGVLPDSDHDGLADYIETYYHTNPNLNDTDLDTLSDWDEINVYHTEPNSNDTDNDGMPDAWEIYYNLDPLVNDANEDKDNDGVQNLYEYLNS